MPLDKNNEFTNFLIYAIITLVGLFIGTIKVIYNLFRKNIDSLWDADKKNKEDIKKNSETNAAINARCEERGKIDKKK